MTTEHDRSDARSIVSGLNCRVVRYLPGPDEVLVVVEDFSSDQGWQVPYYSRMDRNPVRDDPAFMHVDHFETPVFVTILGPGRGSEDQIVEDPDVASVPNGASVEDCLDWARSMLGHYKETGFNRGVELDALEAEFGFPASGQPWCAMFATKAISDHGGVDSSCRTASVDQINIWCAAGTNGYEEGFKANPRSGDLMTFGDDHVALVEKVGRTEVTTIEGNTGAGMVARRVRGRGTGTYVRPEYPA